jgi:hypothetical protein
MSEAPNLTDVLLQLTTAISQITATVNSLVPRIDALESAVSVHETTRVSRHQAQDFVTRESEESYTIYIKPLTTEQFPVLVTANDSIDDVKSKIEQLRGIASSEQRLVYGGHSLKEDRVLGFYSVKPGAVLHLVVKWKGGAT